jgi:hypothetical protein
MCSCPAHQALVDCTCQCDHTDDRLRQHRDRNRELQAEVDRLRAELAEMMRRPGVLAIQLAEIGGMVGYPDPSGIVDAVRAALAEAPSRRDLLVAEERMRSAEPGQHKAEVERDEARAELDAIGRMLASIPEADEPESVKDKAWAALNAITKRNNDLRVDNTALAAKLAAIKALHRPIREGGQGFYDNGRYGYIEPACETCGTSDEYAVEWPCSTARALGEDGGTDE